MPPMHGVFSHDLDSQGGVAGEHGFSLPGSNPGQEPTMAPLSTGQPASETASGDVPKAESGTTEDLHELENTMHYLQGPRFYAANALLGLNFFMVTMELTVVATAIVSISDDIGGFEDSSWIMTSYLLGYVAFVIIFSKLSDIFGRKAILILCIATFTVFSGGCGAAQSINQLIILRAFQGLGGGGCFALNMVCMTEMVPPEKYGFYGATMGIFPVLSMGLGPVIGGAIVSTTTWRWVFLMNIPAGVVALLLAIFSLPNSFPYHPKLKMDKGRNILSTFREASKKIDLLGSALLFLGSLSFAAGFSEADSRFAWNSAYVISLLTASGVLWIALILWERYISLKTTLRQPVLPWQFLTNRAICGMLLSSALLGGPTTATLFVLPSRFQLVNGVSGLDAGIRLLPFAVGTSYGAMVGSVLVGRFKLPSMFVALAGSSLQILGLALLGTLPATTAILPRTYGFQVLAGVGCGVTYQAFYVTMPVVASRKEAAIGIGAVTQFRMMGGAIFLAIATSVFNGHVLPMLDSIGIHSAEELTRNGSDSGIPISAETMDELRGALSEGYNRQMLVFCGSAAAQLFAVLLMWRKPQIVLP